MEALKAAMEKVENNVRIRDIRQANERTLAIVWTDGREDRFDSVMLRRQCPCAACVDEHTGVRQLKASDVPDSVRPRRIQSVGSYAMQIFFDDGHSTGFFTFPYLRELASVPPKQLQS